MPLSTHPISFAAIIVAAGKGLRAGQNVPKQFAMWHGKPLLRHSVEAFAKSDATKIVVVIPHGEEDIAHKALRGIEGIQLVAGGPTRQESVRNGLEALAENAPAAVMIHDAARPCLNAAVIQRLLDTLHRAAGAIPVLPVIDSLSVDGDGLMKGSANRETLRRVQTPQAFRFAEILSAHRDWEGPANAGDDAQVLLAKGGVIAHVEGDEALKKITFAEDFMPTLPAIRTGLGYDVHRLADGEELWLCGVRLAHSKGLRGHSDADVALHAIVDALLGAIAAEDIGAHFPPSDARWSGAKSGQFAEHAARLVSDAGYSIGNIDVTIICEAPKIGPHRDEMRFSIASLLGVDTSQVSVKATTTEMLGFTGRGEGIAAQAIATVMRE